jgi:hypothetical protein
MHPNRLAAAGGFRSPGEKSGKRTQLHFTTLQADMCAAQPERRSHAANKKKRCSLPCERGEPAPFEFVLLHARAAALDQDYQHDHKENAGNDPDYRDIVHFPKSPSTSFIQEFCGHLSIAPAGSPWRQGFRSQKQRSNRRSGPGPLLPACRRMHSLENLGLIPSACRPQFCEAFRAGKPLPESDQICPTYLTCVRRR